MTPQIDFSTATWAQVERWAQARLDQARLANDASLDPQQTASLRGRIQAFKELLGLPKAAARASEAEPAFAGPLGD